MSESHDNSFDDELISAYLDNELSAAERLRVEQAMQQDPALRELFIQLSQLREHLRASFESSRGAPVVDDFAERVRNQITARGERPASPVADDIRNDDPAATDRQDVVSATRSVVGTASAPRRENGFRRGMYWAAAVVAAALVVMVSQPWWNARTIELAKVAPPSSAQPVERVAESAEDRPSTSAPATDRFVTESRSRSSQGGLTGADAAGEAETVGRTMPSAGGAAAIRQVGGKATSVQDALDRPAVAEQPVGASPPSPGAAHDADVSHVEVGQAAVMENSDPATAGRSVLPTEPREALANELRDEASPALGAAVEAAIPAPATSSRLNRYYVEAQVADDASRAHKEEGLHQEERKFKALPEEVDTRLDVDETPQVVEGVVPSERIAAVAEQLNADHFTFQQLTLAPLTEEGKATADPAAQVIQLAPSEPAESTTKSVSASAEATLPVIVNGDPAAVLLSLQKIPSIEWKASRSDEWLDQPTSAATGLRRALVERSSRGETQWQLQKFFQGVRADDLLSDVGRGRREATNAPAAPARTTENEEHDAATIAPPTDAPSAAESRDAAHGRAVLLLLRVPTR